MGDDYFYLQPPDNEATAVYQCEHCGDSIFEGDDYYNIDNETFCEQCGKLLFLETAQSSRYQDYEF